MTNEKEALLRAVVAAARDVEPLSSEDPREGILLVERKWLDRLQAALRALDAYQPPVEEPLTAPWGRCRCGQPSQATGSLCLSCWREEGGFIECDVLDATDSAMVADLLINPPPPSEGLKRALRSLSPAAQAERRPLPEPTLAPLPQRPGASCPPLDIEQVCPDCRGAGTVGSTPRKCPACHGTGRTRTAAMKDCPVCDGMRQPLPCSRCHGTGRVSVSRAARSTGVLPARTSELLAPQRPNCPTRRKP